MMQNHTNHENYLLLVLIKLANIKMLVLVQRRGCAFVIINLNILVHPFHMLGVVGVFGNSFFSVIHGLLGNL